MATIKALSLAILLTAAPLTLWAQQSNTASALAGTVSQRRLLPAHIPVMTDRLWNTAIRATRCSATIS